MDEIQPSLDDDVSAIRDAVMDMGRRMNHPRVRDHVSKMAGVQMDKVGEVILTVIHHHGSEIRLSDVAYRLGVELSSVSRKVQKMEEAGLLKRSEDPADKRVSRIFLTDRGQEVLTKINQARWQMIKDALAQWSDHDRHIFTELFQRFLDDIATHNESMNDKAHETSPPAESTQKTEIEEIA